ncbi:selenocysteine-specific elongation factor [Actinoplanes sp. SE50]|uniref:selenocysteine-specific translation elongation factor n=1 Tax=unclassified Actinoplanes TaxID=2626549 RepID=UPI00023ECF2E|nr:MULTISPECIES: selenocysteine-specific translation elongation factor [unclassified Actinoplanes]AEV86632.1 selenocysteine-specific elongation factor [Actinoplanes sp. SE50/110]ATO85030.1 selenocysteine-specific elongation factor [Actinoplanes sp. SE50]SLM02440.1 SelB translation factor [Actinoplanes sp. SE50/110]
MRVVATAGHVDHGKSTLVRALTGMEPDRWAEERRRGMTIDLGFAWTMLGSGTVVAFVDVPGHERFVPNMLAGVGPVPAAMIVVAADEGWRQQSAEHLAALDALGVRHGLLVVTRSDLADPGAATAVARAEIAATSLGAVEAVPVSAVTGAGLPELRAALDRLVGGLPEPDADAAVRLWIDRSFTIRGAGTVVTGTLGAGTLRAGDELALTGMDRPVRVRGLQSLGEPRAAVAAVARVAVNLRGVEKDAVARGAALLTPGRFRLTDLIDVRLHGAAFPTRAMPQPVPGEPPASVTPPVDAQAGRTGLSAGAQGPRPVDARAGRTGLSAGAQGPRPVDARAGRTGLSAGAQGPRQAGVQGLPTAAVDGLPATATLHVGSAAVPVRVRPLGVDTVRLRLGRALPLRIGDRALLRDPGRHLVIAGVTVLDVAPPAVRRRAARVAELATMDGRPDLAGELRRRLLVRGSVLLGMGVPPRSPVAGDWYADPAHWAALRARLRDEVGDYVAGNPLEPGIPIDDLRHRLGLPDRVLVEALVEPPLTIRGGRVGAGPRELPAALLAALEKAFDRERPFTAPEAHRLSDLGLGARQLAAAVRLGLLVQLAPAVVLPAGAPERAADVLTAIPQPFTLSEARRALDTSRRVAVPLLELLDRTGVTRRLADDRRTVN